MLALRWTEPFRAGDIAQGLSLIPDAGPAQVTYGNVAPAQVVPVAQYQADLAATRGTWQIDEA